MDKRELYRQVAQMHASNIDRGFLSTLGVGFLSLMYRAIDEARDSVLLVDEREGTIVAFVSGGLGMASIYRRMLLHPIRLACSLLPSVLHAQRLLRMFEIVRYSNGGLIGVDLPHAELLSMVVSPPYRGKDVAEQLYKRLVAHFRAEGISAFKITAGEALAPAHRFYRRMGAVPAAEVEVHEGESSTIYVHRIV